MAEKEARMATDKAFNTINSIFNFINLIDNSCDKAFDATEIVVYDNLSEILNSL
jgi:hypothetical protein